VNGVGVLLVDDQRPFLLAAKALFARLDGFDVVGQASSGEEAVDLAADLHPAIVLMDVNMPGIGGIEATRRIVAADADVMVILCSTYELTDLPPDATTSGARGYVKKERLEPHVVQRIWAERETAAFVTT
jgi:two-component system invasion response regulator UvrY